MTEDSSSHWPIKRRYVYYETSRRAGLEFVCIFGHDALAADPDVDAVYVSTPHPFHKDNSILLLERCLRCLLLVMCTYPFAKNALTLHLARGKGRERYFGCNLMQRKVLASSHQHLMAEAPEVRQSHTARVYGRDTRYSNAQYL